MTRRLLGGCRQCEAGRRDSGAVTAEAALALPVLAVAALVGLWAVLLGVGQVRVVDAAHVAARALARGEPPARAFAAAMALAPRGAVVSARRGGGLWQVTVTVRVAAPGGLGGIGSVRLQSTASAAVEPLSWGGGALRGSGGRSPPAAA